jgi:hypothetical protein
MVNLKIAPERTMRHQTFWTDLVVPSGDEDAVGADTPLDLLLATHCKQIDRSGKTYPTALLGRTSNRLF